MLEAAVSAHLQTQGVTLGGLCLQDRADTPRPHAAGPSHLALTETDATETHDAASEDSGSSDSESDNSDSESNGSSSKSDGSGSESGASGCESDSSDSDSEGSEADSANSQFESEEGGVKPEDSKAGCKGKGVQAEGEQANLQGVAEVRNNDVDHVKNELIIDEPESGIAKRGHRMRKISTFRRLTWVYCS